MQLTWDEIKSRAISFSKKWKDAGNEKQEAQSFVRALLNVFGADSEYIDKGFESAVKIDGHDKYRALPKTPSTIALTILTSYQTAESPQI